MPHHVHYKHTVKLRQTTTGGVDEDQAVRRTADKNLPPLTLPSPLLFRRAGRGEGMFESAARLNVNLIDTAFLEYSIAPGKRTRP